MADRYLTNTQWHLWKGHWMDVPSQAEIGATGSELSATKNVPVVGSDGFWSTIGATTVSNMPSYVVLKENLRVYVEPLETIAVSILPYFAALAVELQNLPTALSRFFCSVVT